MEEWLESPGLGLSRPKNSALIPNRRESSDQISEDRPTGSAPTSPCEGAPAAGNLLPGDSATLKVECAFMEAT